MLNNHEEKSEITELYNYDNIAYRDDETANIPYLCNPLMKTAKQFHAKLYFDFGEGFKEECSISQNFFSDINGAFSLTFADLDSHFGKKPIKALRFDPHDGFIKIKIEHIICDDNEIEFVPEKRQHLFHHTNDYDVFYTDDPNYQLFPKNGDIKDIIIEGEIFNLETPFLSSYICTVSGSLSDAVAQLNTTKNDLERTQNDLSKACADFTAAQNELNKVTHDLNLVVNSFSWKITRPIRGIKKIIITLLKK